MKNLLLSAIIAIASIITAFPTTCSFTITVPDNAFVQIADKKADYLPFVEIAPANIENIGGQKIYSYELNLTSALMKKMLRVWGEDYCTQGGLIEVYEGMQGLTFSREELQTLSPKYVNHDVNANEGYNVADLLLNVNAQGHLKMKVGDTYDLLAQRVWQLTNNTTDNLYIDPDYHFRVLNLQGEEDNSVIRMERYHTTTDPWSRLTAVGNGTAIVIVTYDACQTRIYGKNGISPYIGGINQSAIWNENTGVFVVTVGDPHSGIQPNMYINKGMNDISDKLSGDMLDAEHDVLYYIESAGHADYTFTPAGVEKVEISYPVFGSDGVTYNVFNEVARAADGSYTLTLLEGRQIVRMTNADGVSDYQVITAKPCNRTITNLSRIGKPYRAGDKIELQYSGLFHPNNKLSRIYNMSAYITYNGIAGGVSEYGSAGQYTFASAASAQAYKYTIALTAEGEQQLQGGCIQINGYGDPVGNHRNISRTEGRVFNGAAQSHTAYFGVLPDCQINVEALPRHKVRFSHIPDNAIVIVKDDAQQILTPDDKGLYEVVYGSFTYSVSAPGYSDVHSAFTVSLSSDQEVIISVDMTPTSASWDGITTSEPVFSNGVYRISTPSELAWLAQTVNTSTSPIDAVLIGNICLGNHHWTPIGTSTNPYLGTFDGGGYTVSGLNITDALSTMQGLFGQVKNGTVKNLTVKGLLQSDYAQTGGIVGNVNGGRVINCHFAGTIISEKENVGGIVGYMLTDNAVIEECSAEGLIYGTSNIGGIVGQVRTATDTIRNCYNWAAVNGTAYIGGIVGNCKKTMPIEKVYNCGLLTVRPKTDQWGNTSVAGTIGAICGLNAHSNLTDGYAITDYSSEKNADNKTIVIEVDAAADGSLAQTLGWKQTLGNDPYPIAQSTTDQPTDIGSKTTIDVTSAMIYDVLGRPVALPVKHGIYILGGEKVLK